MRKRLHAPLLVGVAPWVVLVPLSFFACSQTPAPTSALPSLGLAGEETYEAYLRGQIPQFKMRHQVEARFGEREEVIEGYLVLARPQRFWVHARSPFGPALFDVRAEANNVEVALHIPAAKDEKLPRYLARDIQRLYLIDCPESSPSEPTSDGRFAISCALPAETQFAINGDDGADDRLEMILQRGGVVDEKRFFRANAPTATARYQDYRKVQGAHLAHRILLEHHSFAYHLRIALVAADLDFPAEDVLQARKR